jgi:hypothetical protein
MNDTVPANEAHPDAATDNTLKPAKTGWRTIPPLIWIVSLYLVFLGLASALPTLGLGLWLVPFTVLALCRHRWALNTTIGILAFAVPLQVRAFFLVADVPNPDPIPNMAWVVLAMVVASAVAIAVLVRWKSRCVICGKKVDVLGLDKSQRGRSCLSCESMSHYSCSNGNTCPACGFHCDADSQTNREPVVSARFVLFLIGLVGVAHIGMFASAMAQPRMSVLPVLWVFVGAMTAFVSLLVTCFGRKAKKQELTAKQAEQAKSSVRGKPRR